jgi:hypothetical protein
MGAIGQGRVPAEDGGVLAQVLSRSSSSVPFAEAVTANGELDAHIFDYALALNEQINILIANYEESLAHWKFERATLLARCAEYERRDNYITELERDLLDAWERIESGIGASLPAMASSEIQILMRAAAQREQHLTIQLVQAQLSEKAALARAERAQQELQAVRRSPVGSLRADDSSSERDQLAKLYHDACEQARKIVESARELEAALLDESGERA